MKVGRIAGALAATLMTLSASGAFAADLRERPYVVRHSEFERFPLYLGGLPSCSDPGVESWIAQTFKQREDEYWHSGLQLSAFTRHREIGHQQSYGPDSIPRRFCAAHVVTTDGRRRDVYWNLALGLGRWSMGPGIDWCVTGLDRNHAYAPNCKMARP